MAIITNRYRKETGKSAFKYNLFGMRIHNQYYIDWLEKQCTIHSVVVPKATLCGKQCENLQTACPKCYQEYLDYKKGK